MAYKHFTKVSCIQQKESTETALIIGYWPLVIDRLLFEDSCGFVAKAKFCLNQKDGMK